MPQDNRIIIGIGVVLAVILAVVLALVFTGGRDEKREPPPASKGGLTVDLADAPTLEPTRELRCFVDGQFVGMATLADCARRNGLATDALDVGLDESGNLAAAPTASLAPPPAQPPAAMVEPTPLTPAVKPVETAAAPAPSPTATGTPCLRYTGSDWRSVASGLSMAQCVRALYAGVCVRPGEAQYGRYGETTLRLVPRRVEQSADNNRFRVLTQQDRNCQFPSLG